jgi:Zn-finger nucleic acid-binding protein
MSPPTRWNGPTYFALPEAVAHGNRAIWRIRFLEQSLSFCYAGEEFSQPVANSMRLLVACTKCQRQYDASRRKSRAKFRCLCGEVVIISKPRGHDATVVRCSSCGAPREKGTADCGHCGSDFTLHERDLHTVCPGCLARVSDKARYCHHCATPLVAEMSTGEKSAQLCPKCEPRRRLRSRRLGDYSIGVLECQTCAGLWFGIRELDHVFEVESRRTTKIVAHSKSAEKPPPSRGYRPCVVCKALMARRNFGKGKSGVIVDVCGLHGLWFDADELSHLIAWTRAGGLEDARLDLARLKNSNDVTRQRILSSTSARDTRRIVQPIPAASPYGIDQFDSNWLILISKLAASFFRVRG